MSSAERWWTKESVALVTGANKGIGFEVARQLCEKGLTVILTARNEERGRAALQSLRAQGFQHNLEFFPFDVTSDESACRLAEWIKHTYGKLDILEISGTTLHECEVRLHLDLQV
ncbi:(-)-isopiperitenone reductase-like [Cryptomeria japonica]|uniref:(-)-isopiperitenone reductase-like n=1 Tax=Cryptomeria japonica TaxID=3369 RepID=UPI0027DA7B32|nr:(-)-isopiperitenone reductase-like [Cryptomeria japonica]